MAEGTPLYLLLDDLAGSTLISGFAFLRWVDHVPEIKSRLDNAPRRIMRDICSGFRDGASSLLSDGTLSGLRQNTARPGPLADPGDPLGWHALDDPPDDRHAAGAPDRRVGRRRGPGIDAMFRDSCWDPGGIEVVIHEYQITATRRAGHGEAVVRRRPAAGAALRGVPGGRAECVMDGRNRPARHAHRGARSARATDCCTHLNDGLRSLAEVPVLAASLPV